MSVRFNNVCFVYKKATISISSHFRLTKQRHDLKQHGVDREVAIIWENGDCDIVGRHTEDRLDKFIELMDKAKSLINERAA
tara:strand:+ start:2151 stop:2393 length:243 start_codon:yes stop_codon:yes gene_type:complete